MLERPPMEEDLKKLKVKYLNGFSSNFKPKLRGPSQNKKCLKRRRPPMEDDLKILKLNISATTDRIFLQF